MEHIVIPTEVKVDFAIKCVWCEYLYLPTTVILAGKVCTITIDNHECNPEIDKRPGLNGG